MNPSSVDIATILEQSDVGVGELAKDMFIHQMPDKPNACIGIYDSPGIDSDPHDYRKPGIQVRVRGERNGYLLAWAKAQEIYLALHERHNEIVGTTRYIQIMAQGDIIDLGNDDNGRPLLTINFLIHRT